MDLQYFDAKLPAEKTILTFNFSAGLINGNVLTGTPNVKISTYLGTDPLPYNIQNGAAGFDTTKTLVLVPVQAGLPACEYLFEVDCATSLLPIYLGLRGVLPIAGQGPV